MKHWKRLLSLVIALVMVLGLLPAAALAVGDKEDAVSAPAEAEAAPGEDAAESVGAVRGGGSGGLLWNCDFEEDRDLIGWQIVNANADPYTFHRAQDPVEEFWYMSSGSDNLHELIVDADDYLISPAIELPEGLELILYTKTAGVLKNGYNANCDLYVYSGDEILQPGNLVTLLGHPYRFHPAMTEGWELAFMDLSAYAGQTVQIVIRHSAKDRSELKIDELSVYWQEPDENLSTVTALNVPLPQLEANVDDLSESDISFPSYANYELVPGSLTYYKTVNEENIEIHDEVFEEDVEYSLAFRVRPKDGIEISSTGYASVNGKWAGFGRIGASNEVLVSYNNLPPIAPKPVVYEVNLLVDYPVAGCEPDTTAESWSASGTTNHAYSILGTSWTPADSVFEEGVSYTVSIRIQISRFYSKADHIEYTINGEPARSKNVSGALYVTQTYTASDREPLDAAEIQVVPPVDGSCPEDPWCPDSNCSTQWAYWYPLNQFGEVMPYMEDDEVFEAGCTYRHYVGIRPNDGYQITPLTRVTINGAEVRYLTHTSDDWYGDCWYYCLDLKAAERDPLVITFNAHGHGTPPDPVEIPYGSSLWSGVYNLTDLLMEDTDGMTFWGWSQHSSDRKDDRLSWYQELYEDTTLYAIWLESIDELELWVDPPSAGARPAFGPYASPEKYTGCTVEPLGWYNSPDGYYTQDFVEDETFLAGHTYYGVVQVEADLWSAFAEKDNIVTVQGATKVSEENSDGVLIVTFSVTIPQRGTLHNVDVWMDTPVPGSSIFPMTPLRYCLTPGIRLYTYDWWESLSDVGDEDNIYTGGFVPGKTLYTIVLFEPEPNILLAEDLQVNVFGAAEFVQMTQVEGMLGAVLKVPVQMTYGFTLLTEGEGWFFFDDPHALTFLDGAYVPATEHTLTAKAEPGWHFQGWYDEDDNLLSSSETYTFVLDRNIDHWTARFAYGEASTVTISFNSHGYGIPPEPVEIPCGAALWSYLDPHDYRMPDTDRLIFFGWSNTERDWAKDVVGNIQEFYESVTLYALWLERLDNMTIYVDAPAAGETVALPSVAVSNTANFEAIPLGWWTVPDSFLADDPFEGVFQAGQTYYGTVRLKPNVDAIFAEADDLVTVVGAAEYNELWMYEDELYVTFSVTIPKRTITELDLFVDIGWNGWLMHGTPPIQLCLTPGVTLTDGRWWASLEDVGDPSKALTDSFPTGCQVYTDLLAVPDAGCTMDPNNLTVLIDGGTLIRTEPGDRGVHVIYSVFSPDYHGYEFYTEGCGWFFLDDDPHARHWYEAPYFETGMHAVVARPDPGWHFVGWYADPDLQVLVSTNPAYVFENEPSDELWDDQWLVALFEEGLLPVQEVDIEVQIPAAGDSFHFETDSAGAVVTNGAAVTITRDIWYNEWGLSGDPLSFEEGQNYFVEVDLQAEPGYEITEDTVFRINGEEVPWKQMSNIITWTVASRNYTMQAAQPIGNLDITLRFIPGAGDYFDSEAQNYVAASTMAQIEWVAARWCRADGVTSYPLIFRNGQQYYAYFEVHGQPGWSLTDATAVTVEGEPPASWVSLGAGRYGLTTRLYTVHEEMVIPTVEAYANIPTYDITPSDPYIPDYEPYYVEDWYWSDSNGFTLPKDFTVMGGVDYTLTVLIKPLEGYMFTEDELKAFLFWDEAEIVSVEPHLAVIRATRTAGMGTPNPFVDVEKGKFYYEPVMWAYYHDPQITAGTDDTHFSPNRDCTRAQVVTFLWRANGCPAPTITEHPFTDVKESAYYYKAMLWAVETGITNGATATTFAPNKACTRAQVVTFLWRAKGSPEPESTECPFTDVKASSAYYKAILWAVEQGITNGTSATTFGPSKTCNRGQVVTFLYRVYGPKG